MIHNTIIQKHTNYDSTGRLRRQASTPKENAYAPTSSDIPSEKGATLLELMLVVSVISILAAMATPNLRRVYLEAEARTQIDDIVAILNDARDDARNLLISVTVSVDDHQLVLAQSGGSSTYIALGDQIEELDIQTDDASFTFSTDGGVAAENPLLISILTASGGSYEITIWPAIGAVRLQ